jgi:hypothetical protein
VVVGALIAIFAGLWGLFGFATALAITGAMVWIDLQLLGWRNSERKQQD